MVVAVPDLDRAPGLAHEAQRAQLTVTLVFTQRQLLACLDLEACDLVVIDPDVADSGVNLVEEVRVRCDAPILFLGSRSCPWHRVALVPDSGAGDVHQAGDLDAVTIVLPDSGGGAHRHGMVSWGRLVVDFRRRAAWWCGRPIHVTPIELRILEALVLADGAVLSVHDLARHLWGSVGPGERERIFAHIRRIRRKIEDDPSAPRFLITVRGEGFRLADVAAGTSTR